MTPAEILVLIQIVSAAVPGFVNIWEKIAANSGGTVRPLADILAESDASLDAIIKKAQEELSK